MNLLKFLQSKTRGKIIEVQTYQPSVQEDPKQHEQHKRIVAAFEAQQQQMNARALKQHAADCPDPWTCTKSPCFIWEPDKIVGEPTIERVKTKKERMHGKT